MGKRSKLVLILSVIVLWSTSTGVVDCWGSVHGEIYHSTNKSYYLAVNPLPLNWLAVPGSGTPCPASLYKTGAPGKADEEIWSVDLTKDAAPGSALVSNTGQYVVTFDYWPVVMVDYGEDVVVIHDFEGRKVRALGLLDLTSEEAIHWMKRELLLVRWRGEQSIDEEHHVLRLKLVLDEETPPDVARHLGYDTSTPPAKEVRIDLATGQVENRRFGCITDMAGSGEVVEDGGRPVRPSK